MKAMLRMGSAVLALCAMAGQSPAGVCARPEDAMALKTAALQQELMVAALSCNDIGPYNRFVVSHQQELQDSDAALLAYFRRADPASGTADYHSYKTLLANTFSLNSLRGMQRFCANARYAFDTAFYYGERQTLADFVSGQRVEGTEDFTPCPTNLAGGRMVRGGSADMPARFASPDRR